MIEDTELSALRRLAFSIAYRMLGSVHDAEDLAQEGLLRLQEVVRACLMVCVSGDGAV